MPNRLESQKSAYLQEHANQPVDWYPWCKEAFAEAEARDRPVLLSVGYSSCHWCHVMARESFSDEETAAFLNRNFVSIKVDREEHPHVDHFYMEVCRMLTGSGGWPLTIFMTPDKRPFFAGTYFPVRATGPLPAFGAVLHEIARLWEQDRKRIIEAADLVTRSMQPQPGPPSSPDLPSRDRLASVAFEHLRQGFDGGNGGFGTAPKFPAASFLEFLLSYHQAERDEEAIDMACTSLEKMRLGGLWDHVGGGFHRYCVDQRWMVPHFEKMLYDQALLILVYSRAFAGCGERLFLRTAEETARFVMESMALGDGGFCSALDADSEGREGAFYLWTMHELKAVLAKDEMAFFQQVFEVSEEGNFDRGYNVLALKADPASLMKVTGLGEKRFESFMTTVLDKLEKARRKRLSPRKDSKVVTSWNALTAGALAELFRLTGKMPYMDAAKSCLGLIMDASPSGEIPRCIYGGRPMHEGCLEDYVSVLDALCRILGQVPSADLSAYAVTVMEKVDERFYDGGLRLFLFDAVIGEAELPARVKPPADGPLPSPLALLYKSARGLESLVPESSAGLFSSVSFRAKRQELAEAYENPLGHCQFIASLLDEREWQHGTH